MITNNVTRMLDSKKIPYKAFELPSEKMGAEETAEYLGVDLSIVYKSIIVKRDRPGKPIIAVVPGDQEVNLKLLAAVIGEKRVTLTTQVEAEKLTGLLAGGISPLALLNRGFLIVLDQSVESLEKIHISGGQRGLNILIGVKDLIFLTQAKEAQISTTK